MAIFSNRGVFEAFSRMCTDFPIGPGVGEEEMKDESGFVPVR